MHAAVSLTVFVWIQDNKGWDWGFGVGAISMLLAVIIFIAGLPMHRIHVVQGSSIRWLRFCRFAHIFHENGVQYSPHFSGLNCL